MDVAGLATVSWLLDQALDRAPDERLSWLEGLGAEYDEVKPKLRRLLSMTPTDVFGGRLDTLPKFDVAASPDTAAAQEANDVSPCPGAIVGAYRLVGPLAEGGMGTVWLAERHDGLVNRPVALKLPRGGWHRPMLAERMAREREFLAALTHPNIARLYDAGVTADGQPYLALEHVDGRPLDVYCRDAALDVPDRVSLFLQVARAVAYAHSKLIVHRDLKPSNILVTPEGQVRLLDFGVAKLLDDDSARPGLTEVAGAALTPEYASPEQITGAAIGVGSDVYSLGVVLYEMLTGARPYDLRSDSRRALEDAVLGAAIKKPSDAAPNQTTRRALTGDLDTIVLKALKRDPAERYLTADALADDLDRYLSGHPVVARPDTGWYRARKFAGRHRVGVTAAAAVTVAVLAGAGTALWQAGVARAEQRRAEVEQRRAEEVKTFIASIFADADPYRRGGANVKAVELLTEARRRLDAMPDADAAMRVELLTILGGSLLRLQDTLGAEAAVSKAVGEGRSQLGAEHPLTLTARLLSVDVHRYRGRIDDMRRELDGLEPVLRRRGAEDAELIKTLEYRSHMELDAGDYAASERAAAEALRLAELALGPRDPKTVQIAMMLAQTFQFGTPRPEQALEASERAMRLASDLHPDEPTYPQVVDMRHIYARALGGAGHFAKGIEELERAIRDASATVGPDGQKVAFMRSNLARIQRRAGRLSGAIENHQASRAVLGRQFALDSWSYLGGVVSQGQTYLAARNAEAAKRDLELSVAGLTRTMGAEHQQVMTSKHNLELARAYLGGAAEAERELVGLLERYRPADPAMLAPPLLSLGVTQRLAGKSEAAIATLERARQHFGAGVATELDRLHASTEIGLAQVDLARFDDARTTLSAALQGFQTVQLEPTPARADALVGLGRALLGLGRPSEARPHLQEADAFWRGFDARSRGAANAARWLGAVRSAAGRAAAASVAHMPGRS